MPIINLMVNLRREQLDICCWEMVGNSWQVDGGARSINKLVQRSSNTNHFIDFCYITNINITLNIANKVATKRCQPADPPVSHIRIKVLGSRWPGTDWVHLKSTTKTSNSIQRRLDLLHMIIVIAEGTE